MEEIAHENHFCIAGRFKWDALLLQFAAEAGHVVDFAVVADDSAMVS